jgi:hypothetical protein
MTVETFWYCIESGNATGIVELGLSLQQFCLQCKRGNRGPLPLECTILYASREFKHANHIEIQKWSTILEALFRSSLQVVSDQQELLEKFNSSYQAALEQCVRYVNNDMFPLLQKLISFHSECQKANIPPMDISKQLAAVVPLAAQAAHYPSLELLLTTFPELSQSPAILHKVRSLSTAKS